MKIIQDVKRILGITGMIIILVGVSVLFTGGLRIRGELRRAFLEAKNIELTLRLISYEYYKEDRRIYDALRQDGLTEGVAEEVKYLSNAQGSIALGYWDTARQAAGSFVYKKGNIMIFYEYDKNTTHEDWNIYYSIYNIKN